MVKDLYDPPEPPEEEYTLNMFGREIYEGEQFYDTVDGYVATNSVLDYIVFHIRELTLEELNEIAEEYEIGIDSYNPFLELLVEALSSNFEKHFGYDLTIYEEKGEE